jgi:hypothetical protein
MLHVAQQLPRNLCLGAIFFLLLPGCAHLATPAARPYLVEVPVPTPIYCDVPALPRPALPIATLGAGSAPADTVRSYAATVVVLKAALIQRDSILAGCAPPAPASTPASAGANKL